MKAVHLHCSSSASLIDCLMSIELWSSELFISRNFTTSNMCSTRNVVKFFNSLIRPTKILYYGLNNYSNVFNLIEI